MTEGTSPSEDQIRQEELRRGYVNAVGALRQKMTTTKNLDIDPKKVRPETKLENPEYWDVIHSLADIRGRTIMNGTVVTRESGKHTFKLEKDNFTVETFDPQDVSPQMVKGKLIWVSWQDEQGNTDFTYYQDSRGRRFEFSLRFPDEALEEYPYQTAGRTGLRKMTPEEYNIAMYVTDQISRSSPIQPLKHQE